MGNLPCRAQSSTGRGCGPVAVNGRTWKGMQLTQMLRILLGSKSCTASCFCRHGSQLQPCVCLTVAAPSAMHTTAWPRVCRMCSTWATMESMLKGTWRGQRMEGEGDRASSESGGRVGQGLQRQLSSRGSSKPKAYFLRVPSLPSRLLALCGPPNQAPSPPAPAPRPQCRWPVPPAGAGQHREESQPQAAV